MKHVFVVTSVEDRLSLPALLSRRLSRPETEVARWIASGSVYVDGRRVGAGAPLLTAGQRVVAHEVAAEAPRGDRVPRLVYRDQQLAVLEKPAGLPSIPTRRGGTDTVVAFVARELGSGARLLHRLDAEASGLLLVGLTPPARRHVAAGLAQHRLHRSYLAVAAGRPAVETLVLRSRLAARGTRVGSSQDPRARAAETTVRLLRSVDDRCLLQVELSTGRMHQIRVHLAEHGMPLLGDRRYGGRPADRLALHAHCLRLTLPGGAPLEVHSPLPRALGALLGQGVLGLGD